MTNSTSSAIDSESLSGYDFSMPAKMIGEPFSVNQTVGRWTIIGGPIRHRIGGKLFWQCQCSCGSVREVLDTSLRSDKSFSCGCGDGTASGSGVRVLTGGRRDQLCRDYKSGASLKQLASKYGVCYQNVHGILRRRGVPRRPPFGLSKNTVDESSFDRITEESAYWIGMLIADGCIVRHRYGQRAVVLSLAGQDGSHVDTFRDFLKSSHTPNRVSDGNPKHQPQRRLSVRSERIVCALERFGVTERKSHTAKVVGLENDRHFWRGVIDGDGSVYLRNNSPIISLCGSIHLVNQFRDYALSLTFSKRLIYSTHRSFVYGIQGTAAIPVIRSLYSECTVALPRKLAVAEQILLLGRPLVR